MTDRQTDAIDEGHLQSGGTEGNCLRFAPGGADHTTTEGRILLNYVLL